MPEIIKVDGLKAQDYLNLMKPIRYATDSKGLIIQSKNRIGLLENQKLNVVKYIFSCIGHFFRRLSHCHWKKDDVLVQRLRKGIHAVDLSKNKDLFKRIYQEFTLRLPVNNSDLAYLHQVLYGSSQGNTSQGNTRQGNTQKALIDEMTGRINAASRTTTTTPSNKPAERLQPPTLDDSLNNIKYYAEQASKTKRPKAKELESKLIERHFYKLNKALEEKNIQTSNYQNREDSVVNSMPDEMFLTRNQFEGFKCNFSDLPVLFKYQDILDNIRLALMTYLERPEQAKLSTLMDDIKRKIEKDQYVYKDKIELPYYVSNNLTEYISSYDYRNNYPQHRQTAEFKDLEKYNLRPGLAVKKGWENERELLAGKMLEILKLDKYFVPKIEVKNPSSMLTEYLSLQKNALVSSWVSGDNFFTKEWRVYVKLKRDLAAEEFKGHDPIKIKNLKNKLNTAENIIKGFGCFESTQELALADLLFWSTDSHEGQYKLKDGELYNFDFARHLTASETYIIKGIPDSLASSLKSTLLDHPACNFPINDQLLNKIKNYDIAAIEKALEQYKGDAEEMSKISMEAKEIYKAKKSYEGNHNRVFREKLRADHEISLFIVERALDKLKNKRFELLEKASLILNPQTKISTATDFDKLQVNLLNVKSADSEFNNRIKEVEQIIQDESYLAKGKKLNRKICERYSIDPYSTSDKVLEIFDFKEGLKKQECFKKIHPLAFKAFIRRLTELKKYVENNSQPTIAGAFAAMCPDLNLIIQALKRYDTNPFLAIGCALLNNNIQTPNFICNIINNLKSGKLITEDEEDQIKKARDRLVETACDDTLMFMSYNF